MKQSWSHQLVSLVRSDGLRFLRFSVVGIINTGVDFLVFSVLVFGLGIWLVAANPLSFLVAVVVSFLLNRYWTFSSTSAEGASMTMLLRFFLLSAATAALSTVALWLMVKAGLAILMAKLAATALSMALNYLVMSRIIFHTAPGARSSGQVQAE